jgi:hypothetical protein
MSFRSRNEHKERGRVHASGTAYYSTVLAEAAKAATIVREVIYRNATHGRVLVREGVRVRGRSATIDVRLAKQKEGRPKKASGRSKTKRGKNKGNVRKPSNQSY